MTIFLRNHVNLHLLWLSDQNLHTRDQTENNFTCEEVKKVYDNHKINSIALLILTFCVGTSIQSNFFAAYRIV